MIITVNKKNGQNNSPLEHKFVADFKWEQNRYEINLIPNTEGFYETFSVNGDDWRIYYIYLINKKEPLLILDFENPVKETTEELIHSAKTELENTRIMED